MYSNRVKQWLIFAMIVFLCSTMPDVSQGFEPCSRPGTCRCNNKVAEVCSEGYWYPANSIKDPQCMTVCGTTPVVDVPGKTKTGGFQQGKTPGLRDPISAAGGEFREEWNLLSLGGLIPVEFTLMYAPDLAAQTPTSDGRPQFPPTDTVKAFTSNTVMRLAEFTDKSVTPDTDYVNILMGNDLLVFKLNAGKYLPVGPDKYQLEKKSSGYFYLMNPADERVYVFQSRELNYDRTTQLVKRVGEIVYILDRNGTRLTYTYNEDYLPLSIEENSTGRKLNLTYTDGNLSSVTDSFGRSVSFVYQTLTCGGKSVATLTGFKDAMSQETDFVYDTATDPCYLIRKINHPLGNSHIDQTWTDNPKGVKGVNSQKDAYGNEAKLSWSQDAQGNLVTAVDYPDGTQQIFNHESERYPTERKDSAGKTASMKYSADNQLSEITDRIGDKTLITYHAESGNIASLTNAEGNTLSYAYTAQNQTFSNPANSEQASFTFYKLSQITYPDGTAEKFVYNDKGSLTEFTDREDNVSKTAYNDSGLPLTIINPSGGVITYTYNADGTHATLKDSVSNAVTSYAYDTCKRLNRITYPDGSFTQIAYNPNDQITQVTDENGNKYVYEYDKNGNLIKITDPAGKSVQYSYDNMDRLIRITDRLGKSATIAYDKMGRPESVTDAGGLKTEYAYNPNGWLNKAIQAGKTWQFEYDAEGILKSSSEPSGSMTAYQSDKLGNIKEIADALNSRTTLERDKLSRVTRVTDALNRPTVYDYDGQGLLSGVTLPEVGTAEYARNPLGLLSQISDLKDSVWKFDYDGIGRILSATDPLENIRKYFYDNRNRLSGIEFPDGTELTQTFDAAGNLTEQKYSDGTVLQFTYDALNRLLTADSLKLTPDAEGNITATEDSGSVFGAAYDDSGKLKTLSYNNSAFTVVYTYEAGTGYLSGISDSLTNTQIGFSYDADGRMTGITRPNKVNSTLAYDKAGRLTGIAEGSIIALQYTLDAAGQVTKADMTLPLNPLDMLVFGQEKFGYDSASQIDAEGYQYDKIGRIGKLAGKALNWDGASRLREIGDVKLAYNGLGDMISRTEGGNTLRYFYNYAVGLNPIMAEKDETAGNFLRYYVWTPGGQLLYMIDAADGNKVYFYHFDRIGSTLALTDASGTITDKYAYDPYGRLLQHEGTNLQPFTFVGQWGVRSEGADGTFYHMRARYYDASSAHFVSREPVWPQIENPREINPYQYALNTPMNLIDINGMDAMPYTMLCEWGEFYKHCNDTLTHDEIMDILDKVSEEMGEKYTDLSESLWKLAQPDRGNIGTDDLFSPDVLPLPKKWKKLVVSVLTGKEALDNKEIYDLGVVLRFKEFTERAKEKLLSARYAKAMKNLSNQALEKARKAWKDVIGSKGIYKKQKGLWIQAGKEWFFFENARKEDIYYDYTHKGRRVVFLGIKVSGIDVGVPLGWVNEIIETTGE